MASATMFGLDIEAAFALPGVPEATPRTPASRPFLLSLTGRDEVLARWPEDDCEHLADHRDDAGAHLVRIDSHAAAGTFIELAGAGVFHIAADARSADLAPADADDWQWQRALTGQILPFAAVLNGLEVLHASAVSLGDAAVAVVGGTHAGKSSLAATWLGRGASLVADDVVSLEHTGGVPIVHPGPPLLSLREGTRQFLGDDEVDALGRRIGEDAGGVRIAATRHHADPLPLGAVVILRRDESHERLYVARETSPDPRLILATTFNFVVQTAERLTRHLDLAAAIAASVPVIVADAGAGHPPTAIADAIASELGL